MPIWQRKGDVHDPGNYRRITLLNQVLKLWDRVLDAMIRRRVECDSGEEQYLFRKRREVQGNITLVFVDLEKPFDTVPREMVRAPLRWKGVPEAEVRMTEGM